MAGNVGLNEPLKWAVWHPQLKLLPEIIHTRQIANGGVQSLVRFDLANSGRANAVDPDLTLHLPNWDFGRRQGAAAITRGKSTSKSSGTDKDKLGLDFSDAKVECSYEREGRIGNGEKYKIDVSGVIPKRRKKNLCFGYVILDRGQSNTLRYTVRAQNQGLQSGQVTFEGKYNEMTFSSDPPSIWSERLSGAKARIGTGFRKARNRLVGSPEIGNVDLIERMPLRIKEEDGPVKWLCPRLLVRLSQRVSTPRDINAKFTIRIPEGGRRKTIAQGTLHSYAISPGEYWEITVPGYHQGAYSSLLEGRSEYGRALDAILPVPLEELDNDIEIEDIEVKWELTESEMPSRDVRNLEIRDTEMVDRGIPTVEGRVENKNNTARSAYVVVKFIKKSNEVLLTPVTKINVDGKSEAGFRSEFRPSVREFYEAPDRYEVVLHGSMRS